MKSLFSFLIVILISTLATGQDCIPANKLVWEKYVTRTIDVPILQQKGSKVSLNDRFVMAFLKGIKEHKLKAYTMFAPFLGDEMRFEKLTNKTGDENLSIDSINGRAVVNSQSKSTEQTITRYETYEHWVFNPYSLSTTVTIVGLAPMAVIHHEDGSFRASGLICWLKFEDLSKFDEQVFKDFKRYLMQQLVNDYATDSTFRYNHEIHANQNEVYAHISRILEDIDNEDTVRCHLRDNFDDRLFNQLQQVFVSGKIPVYTNLDLAHPLTLAQIKKKFTMQFDVDPIVDPTTHTFYEMKRIDTLKKSMEAWSHLVNVYRLHERFSFNPYAGVATIEPYALEALNPVYKDNGDLDTYRSVVFLKYRDVEDIINQYEHFNNDKTFARQLWDSYFSHAEYMNRN
jgi:hypothetical protein